MKSKEERNFLKVNLRKVAALRFAVTISEKITELKGKGDKTTETQILLASYGNLLITVNTEEAELKKLFLQFAVSARW